MQRDMSCELDGVFSTRNAGELVSHAPAKTVMTRVGGLMEQKTRPAAVAGYEDVRSYQGSGVRGYTEARSYSGSGVGADFLGAVSDLATPKNLVIAGVAAAAAWYFLLRK